MNRDDFMRKLEYLLQDIPETEKADALEYYRDYLEEAGEEAEDTIKEFGSPERIAAIIRSDIAGHLENGGGFTERGYEDERFRDPNYQVAERYQVPEVQEESGSETSDRRQSQPRTSQPLKILLWIILILVSSPLWLSIGGVLLGFLASVLGILFSCAVAVGLMTLAFLVAGVVAVVAGLFSVFSNPLGGLLAIGVGLFFLGLGFLGLVISIQFYGRFIPWIFRGIVDMISGLFRKRGVRR